MALPFFRKDRSKPEPVAEASQRTTSLNPALSTIGTGAPVHHGIVVEEVGGGADAAIGEIAILYASGQLDSIEPALKDRLTENNPRIWHMLFDFYRLTQRQAEFDRLGLDFAMRFESSPPVWQNAVQGKPVENKSTRRLLSLPQRLDGTIGKKLSNILSSLDKNTTLQLDFSKISEITPDGAHSVSDILAASRKQKFKFRLSGATGMVDLLRSRIHAEPGAQSYWRLLMAIYQLLGKQTEFEDMAVDFAVAFDLSPPSWETVQIAEEVAAPAPEIPKDAFVLSGVVDARLDPLGRLMQHAESRQQVVVDCSAVSRVDYAYVSNLIGSLMQLLGNGKTIVLQGQNALVNELFITMGIDQLATLVPARLN